MGQHSATAARALKNKELVDAVTTDWRSAPLPEGLKATLGLIEKLTLKPSELTSADVDLVRAAGVSEAAIEDAIHVAVIFVMINKLADAFDWELLTDEVYDARAEVALERGYVIPPQALE